MAKPTLLQRLGLGPRAGDPFAVFLAPAAHAINQARQVHLGSLGLELANKRVLEVGIGNYIIDDGWFGPGLDSPYETALNIVDWRPAPAKFPDLASRAGKIGEPGAVGIIWCAPTAGGQVCG